MRHPLWSAPFATLWLVAETASVAQQPISDIAKSSPSPSELHVIIESNIQPAQKVGSLKKGMLCLPAGKLTWEQLKLPSESKLAERLSRVVFNSLEKQVIADNMDPLRIVIEIKAIEVSQCAAGLGMGEMKPKVKIAAQIEWKFSAREALQAAEATEFDTVKVEILDSDVRYSSTALESALEASLTRVLSVSSAGAAAIR